MSEFVTVRVWIKDGQRDIVSDDCVEFKDGGFKIVKFYHEKKLKKLEKEHKAMLGCLNSISYNGSENPDKRLNFNSEAAAQNCLAELF